ncbi:MAG: hypothetical protein ABSA33_03250 [Candidatus Micrarchaeaceae archaeon]|jgi:hypothetical protein
MSLPIKRDPSHILKVKIPLDIADRNSFDIDFDPVRDAMVIVLAVSRAAYEGYICGQAEVNLEEVPPPPLYDLENFNYV